MHVRDIQGHVIRSYPQRPLGFTYAASLGEVADRCVDTIGYLPDVVTCLHKVYLDAAPLSDPVGHFVDEMVAHGMPYAEAVLWWEVMDVNVHKTTYRNRVDLSSPL